ncbi:MAG: phage/plasmid primase, P4 family [Candidatus Nitrosocosmicus sp.]
MSNNYNQFLDYFYYDLGLNVIPVQSKSKQTLIQWKEWQVKPIPEQQFKAWKDKGLFDSGYGIITGKIWRGSFKDKYLLCIDIDNSIGLIDFMSFFIETKSIEELSKKTMVIQHEDTKEERAHIYFITDNPINKKNRIVSSVRINHPQVAEIEIKSDSSTYMIGANSIHKSGYPYQVIGTKNIQVLNTEKSRILENAIDRIYNKYLNRTQFYLIDNYQNNGNNIDGYGGISLLDNDLRRIARTLQISENNIKNCKIYEGRRHSTLLSFANSMLFQQQKNRKLNEFNFEKLKHFLLEVNQKLCFPSPLQREEIERIWIDARKYLSNNSIYKLEYLEDNEASQRTNDNKNNIKHNISIEQKTEEILRRYHFITLEESKEILYYCEGAYVSGGDIVIEKVAEELFGYSLANKDIAEIKGHIMRKTFHKRSELDNDINIVNLENGLYYIDKDELKEHSPHYLSINQKPISYDKNATARLFGKFLEQVLYPAEIRTAVESMAYTFYRDSPFEHLFILYGEGGNGKSVFTGLLTALHGERNVSNVSLHSITNNTFALSDLEFKDVNVDTELSNVGAKDTSNLKKLTGGRKQPVRIERKNQHARDTLLHTKLFFNTNQINPSSDQTDAYFRREILISFPNSFHGKRDDPNLLNKLKQELPGIFNALMIALRTILRNKHLYFNNKTIDERRLKHEISANPIDSFINEVADETSTCEDRITKEDLYEVYLIFCDKYSIAKKSRESFGKELKKRQGVIDGREGKGERRRTLWYGMKLRDEYANYLSLRTKCQTTLSFESS